MEPEQDVSALECTGSYRVLRKCLPVVQRFETSAYRTFREAFLDVETTGLCPAADQIIELAVVPFEFSIDGTLHSIEEWCAWLEDPRVPIPEVISKL